MSDPVYTRTRSQPFEITSQTVGVLPELGALNGILLHYSYTTELSAPGVPERWSVTTLGIINVSPPGSIYDQFIGETTKGRKDFPDYSSGDLATPSVVVARDTLIDIINDKLTAYVENLEEGSMLHKRDGLAVIRDVPTKNYKKLRNEGKIINNPVSNFKASHVVDHRYLTIPSSSVIPYVETASRLWGNNVLRSNSRVNPAMSVNFPLLSDSDVENIMDMAESETEVGSFDSKQVAIDKAFGGINDGAFSYLEELGEAKETIAYIASVFARIAGMVKSVKRGEFVGIIPKTHKRVLKKAKRLAKKNNTSWQQEYANIATDFAASAWMELRFAIRPLVFSVEDAVTLHKEGLQSIAGRSTSNFKIASVGSISSIEEFFDIDNTIRTVVHKSVESERISTAGVLIDISSFVKDARMLGFTNLAGTLWELTFLSWAVDYFLSLDGLLYHLTPDIGVEPLAAWSGTDDRITVKHTITRNRVSDGLPLDETTIKSSLDVYQRHPVTSPGYISINIDLDVNKVLDLAALFKGFARK